MRTGRAKTWPVVAVALTAVAALSMLTAGVATSSERIMVTGSDASTHVRLSVSGDEIVVEGSGISASSACEQRSPHAFSCPLRGVDSIEVDTGPQDDKVEVLDRLPIPLTVRLGAGSDKLVGNGEADTCYPEEAKRNRCYGFGGDDVCITGEKNSDCVGGDGNDYCRHGNGSDGCWGGNGDDVCVMGAGKDGCHGEAGDDRLYGGPDPDQLYGGAGHDYCDGGPGVGYSHTCESGPGH